MVGMRLLGYTRVSTVGQDPTLQHDALVTAGVQNRDVFSDVTTGAKNAIERLTRGNFRVVERLFPQIKRVLKINELETITDDVIEAAASTLVLGH